MQENPVHSNGQDDSDIDCRARMGNLVFAITGLMNCALSLAGRKIN